ncbi:SDR family oxidoreductase [Chryseobacterium sp. CT-SW4]|uniref:SDR family oxidoreductase n=1 Tax=Chryseobacterium sp. SW-1 TaxID=3157343 RepID=UPI003B01FC8F
MEYVKDGILTNIIAPGAILTSMVADAFKRINPDNPKKAEVEYTHRNPARALGKPKDGAKLVSFLISDENGYVNGWTWW